MFLHCSVHPAARLMQLLNIAKSVASGFIDAMTSDWWVEVTTTQPRCVYYFGPFDREKEAAIAQPGYLEDLAGEGAQGVAATVKRCKPIAMTIVDDYD